MAEPPFIFLTAAALLRYNIENISPEKGASFVAFVRKKSVLPIYLVGATWLVCRRDLRESWDKLMDGAEDAGNQLEQDARDVGKKTEKDARELAGQAGR